MIKIPMLIFAFVLFALAAAPGSAEEAACVRLNEIRSIETLDDRTLVVTNRQEERYSIYLSGPCPGLTIPGVAPTFRPQSELDCLRRGDRISFNYPGQGLATSVRPVDDQEVCFVESVSSGVPE